MDAKKKFFIMLGVMFAVLVLGLSVIFYLYYRNQNTDNAKIGNNQIKTNQTAKNNTSQTVDINGNAIIADNTNQAATPPARTEAEEKKYVVIFAKDFTERFGTYSNQNNASNLLNLKNKMTPNMQEWTDKLIANNEKKPDSVYYEVISTAVTSELADFNNSNNSAKVVIGVIQQEKTGMPAVVSTKKQKLVVELKRENNIWLVNSAYWHSY